MTDFDHVHTHKSCDVLSCLITGVEYVANRHDRHDSKSRLEPCIDHIHRPQRHLLHTAAGGHKLESAVAWQLKQPKL